MSISCGDYIIKSDKFCMWIEKKRTEDGKEVYQKVAGYSHNFEQLLDSFVQSEVLDSESEKVKDLLAKFKDIEKRLREFSKVIAEELEEIKEKTK